MKDNFGEHIFILLGMLGFFLLFLFLNANTFHIKSNEQVPSNFTNLNIIQQTYLDLKGEVDSQKQEIHSLKEENIGLKQANYELKEAKSCVPSSLNLFWLCFWYFIGLMNYPLIWEPVLEWVKKRKNEKQEGG